MEEYNSDIKDHLEVINFEDRQILILGTAHVSKKSVEEVKFIIKKENPDCICVELDEARYNSIQNSSSYSNMDIFKILKEKKALFVLVNIILSTYQKKIGKELEIKPGMEMIRAIEIAKDKNINIELCDRSVQVTLTRTWRKSSFFSKISLIGTLFASAFSKEEISEEHLENLKKKNELENILDEMGKEMPKVKEILIDERDKFLSKKIFSSKGIKILAVVGAGHKKGIIKHIHKLENKKENINLEELNEIPKTNFSIKIIPYAISLLLIILIFWGFFKGRSETSIKNIFEWIVINGTFSAIGALISAAHPLVIIASFIVAPIASLNPTIGTGIICALIQAWIEKPDIADLEKVSDNSMNLKGFYKNKFLKVILVLLLTTIGSAIATFVAIPFLLKN